MAHDPEQTDRPFPPGPPPLVWAIAAVFLLIEVAFQMGDSGVLGLQDLRWQGYLRLAFFNPFFQAGINGQDVPWTAWTGLLTHAFVHGGVVHVALNTVIFLALAGLIANALGTVRFLVLFVVTALGGILTFFALSSFEGPVVGASGVVFGLMGALKRWEWRYIQATGAPANRFWGTIIALSILNAALALYFPFGGGFAWQAHLGGFVAGFLVAGALAPRFAAPSPI